ncbi:MAG: hypothetical protein VX899_14465 [Myxococcota bacterium]|nr:hypothetical protein [Myxococcota bacterium]
MSLFPLLLLTAPEGVPEAPSPPTPGVLAAKATTHCGDPENLAYLAFTLETRVDGVLTDSRSVEWSPRKNTATVTWGEHRVELTQLSPYIASEASPELAIQAYQHWAHDTFRLLAACEAQHPAAVSTVSEDGRLHLEFGEEALIRWGDHYWYQLNADGSVQDLEFRLSSGESGRFSWTGYKRVGPLYLATERISTDGHTWLKFAELQVR